VSDRFDDISEFRKDFPALHDASIEREVLPAWEEDRSSRAAAELQPRRYDRRRIMRNVGQ